MKNSKKKLICGTLIAATITVATASIIVHNQKEKCLNIVKQGTSKVDTSITYEKAFNKYLNNANWITIKTVKEIG